MSKKRFDHFMNYWQLLLQPRRPKPAGDRRAARAKARLRLALASTR
jgi:hypothetical protein